MGNDAAIMFAVGKAWTQVSEWPEHAFSRTLECKEPVARKTRPTRQIVQKNTE